MLPLALAALTLSVAAAPAPAAAQAPSACQSGAAMPSPENLDQVRDSVLCLLNRERTRRGLSRLRGNDRLERAATSHSRDMVRRDFFDHVSPGGTSPAARVRQTGYLSGARGWMVGENIAWGTFEYAAAAHVVDVWMHSPGHRANILRDQYRDIGIGIALGAPGHDDEGATYTTEFGTRL